MISTVLIRRQKVKHRLQILNFWSCAQEFVIILIMTSNGFHGKENYKISFDLKIEIMKCLLISKIREGRIVEQFVFCETFSII